MVLNWIDMLYNTNQQKISLTDCRSKVNESSLPYYLLTYVDQIELSNHKQWTANLTCNRIFCGGVFSWIYIIFCCRPKERIKILLNELVHEEICLVRIDLFILSYIRVYFQLDGFVREHVWHKALFMGYSMRRELSHVSCLNGFHTYLGSSVESTEKNIETRLTKAWTAINRLSTIWKSDLTDKMKSSFFQAAVTSILLYGCTTWTLTKRLEKKLDGNYTRMLRAILNKSWQQHPTRHQLYGHLPPITKTIQVRRTRHAGHCWRSRDELIRDVLLWIPTHGRAKAGRPARTYIQQLCEDTGCCPEDLPRAMNDREEWRERVRDIRAASTI